MPNSSMHHQNHLSNPTVNHSNFLINPHNVRPNLISSNHYAGLDFSQRWDDAISKSGSQSPSVSDAQSHTTPIIARSNNTQRIQRQPTIPIHK